MSATAPASALQLRDIHLPSPPSSWPPAPGWWLLAVLVIALVFFATRWIVQRARERRWRRRVQLELDRIAATQAATPDTGRLTTDLSRLLRRTCLMLEPGAAALHGDAWLDFLDRQLPASRAADAPFRNGPGRALIDAPYRRSSDPAATISDSNALLDLARHWLVAALPRRRGHA